MAIEKASPINSENVRKLVQTLKRNPELKKNAVARLRRNLYAFVESTFNLTPAQKKEMRTKMPKDVADVIGRACATVLEHNGELEFQITHERRYPDKPNVRVEIYHRPEDDEWGVRITWEK